jgi:hypothetical protein
MPDSDMLDTGVLFSNQGDHMFQAIWKCFSLGLEFFPAVLKLTMTTIVN